MKNYLLVLPLLLAGVFGINTSYADDFRDEKTYPILDECSYAVLTYDFGNSMILNFLGAPKLNPDQAGQIMEIEEKNPEAVMDAEFRWALILGESDLLKNKQQAIKIIQEQDINIMQGNSDLERNDKCLDFLYDKAKQSMNEIVAEHKLDVERAFIDFYIFHPLMYYYDGEVNLPVPLLNMAKSIAITRFDNQKWRQKIYSCYKEKQPNSEDFSTEKLIECVDDYEYAVSNEMKRAVKELLPHKKYFINLKPVPDASEMEKVEKGNTYTWVEKVQNKKQSKWKAFQKAVDN